MINDERMRQAYEGGLPSGADLPPLDDVAAERLRRLVEREGSDEERLRTLDQQLSSAEGRRELELLWAAARVARPRQRVGPQWMIAASMLLVASVGGGWLLTRDSAPAVRGDDSPITLVAPLGTQRAGVVSRFVWRSYPDAERYTLVVVDSAGREVYATDTRDTAATLPDSVHLTTGDYLWWVQARTRLGASITAVTQTVKITAP